LALTAQAKEPKKPREGMIPPGRSVSGALSLRPESPWYKTYRVEVPEDAFGIRLSLNNCPADLDLFIKYGEEIISYDDVSAFSALEDYNEELFYSRLNNYPLQSGVYYVDVAYQLDEPPKLNGRVLWDVPFTLNYEIIPADSQGLLTPNSRRTATLEPAEGMIKIFTVQVPQGTQALRVDLFDTAGDLDLMINKDRPAMNPNDADLVSEWVMSRESVVWKNTTESPLTSGTYYVTVFDQIIDDAPEAFSITASLSEDPAPFLQELPFLTTHEDGMMKALSSTLEIIAEGGTGSGCLVSSKGLVLTNWHVIRGYSGKPSDKIFGAATLDPAEPPVELFQMEVLQYNEEKDIALLRVTGGFYGQDLPFGYTFPFFELAGTERVNIGQPMIIIGYPGIGGTGSRSSISITQGIVSGFQKASYGTIIKTDAEINGGNSGGAAINAFYELIGLPTMVVNEDAGQMGFIHPVGLLPDLWLNIIERDGE